MPGPGIRNSRLQNGVEGVDGEFVTGRQGRLANVRRWRTYTPAEKAKKAIANRAAPVGGPPVYRDRATGPEKAPTYHAAPPHAQAAPPHAQALRSYGKPPQANTAKQRLADNNYGQANSAKQRLAANNYNYDHAPKPQPQG